MDIATLVVDAGGTLDGMLLSGLTADFFPALAHVAAGAAVGFAIGVTGVGGGSLMTPLLLLFGYAPAVAIGTDLLYAALTKTSGVIAHQEKINRLGSGENTCSGKFTRSTDDALGPVWRLSGQPAAKRSPVDCEPRYHADSHRLHAFSAK